MNFYFTYLLTYLRFAAALLV